MPRRPFDLMQFTLMLFVCGFAVLGVYILVYL